jgi:hypothetical protein
MDNPQSVHSFKKKPNVNLEELITKKEYIDLGGISVENKSL